MSKEPKHRLTRCILPWVALCVKADSSVPAHHHPADKEARVEIIASIPGEHAYTVTVRLPWRRIAEAADTAEALIDACNAHDDLVAALHDIRRVLVRLPRNADERLRTLTLTDAALAKAEPEC